MSNRKYKLVPEDILLNLLSDKDHETRIHAERQLLSFLAEQQVEQEPVEFDYPEYHEQGMRCGLEDRDITDRYEAMRYGWDGAIDRIAEVVDNLGPIYTAPPAAPDVSGLVEALKAATEYLDSNSLNQIGSSSILHRQMCDALSTYQEQQLKSAQCPACATINRRDGYGPVACRKCERIFNILPSSREQQGGDL